MTKETYVSKALSLVRATPYKKWTVHMLNTELGNREGLSNSSGKHVNLVNVLDADPLIKKVSYSQITYDPDDKYTHWKSTRQMMEEHLDEHGFIDRTQFCRDHDIEPSEFTAQIGNMRHQRGRKLTRTTIYRLEEEK